MPISDREARRLLHSIAFGHLPPAPDDASPRLAATAARIASAHAPWWDPRNVVGLCYAPKVRRGRVEDLSIQVLVRAKRPRSRVLPHQLIPRSIALTGLGRGRLPTDVREVGVPSLDVLVSDMRPALPGYNISHRSGGSGTLGCAVRSLDTGERLGLSCGHVIARYGRASRGEPVFVPSLEEAQANDLLDSAPFGVLESVGQISFDREKAATNVDAATVRPDTPTALDNRLALLDLHPSGVRQDAPIGLPVHKVGFVSEQTYGVIVAQHAILGLPFVDEGGKTRTVWFTDLLSVTSFTEPGDSGALVMDLQGQAVGLHMASTEGMSLCAPIQRVLDSMRCTLDVGGPLVS